MNRLPYRRRPPQVRIFKCTVCGVTVPATKKPGHVTVAGHIKTMWCYHCEKITDHIQIE